MLRVKNGFAIGLVGTLLGCGTLQNSATQNVRYRMTQGEVRGILGDPHRVVPIPEEQATQAVTWVYWLDGEICQIDFKLGQVVKRPACIGADRKKELEAVALERDPAQRERDLREAKEKKKREDELNRWQPKLREPE